MFKTSLVLALISVSAVAAPQVSEHERALQKASKWSDVTAQLKGRLPSNVVKEFADFAKGEEFPSTRRIKNKLVITESDGTKVTIEYKKDGAISLNGKDWKLKPLATVEEEVSRLALFIAGEKKASAGFFGLLPAAQAGGAAMGGAAIAAFAGANAWKAESCGEKELSGDLVNDCPLMAVKMQPILVKAEAGPTKNGMYPIQLKCPAENSGRLELVHKSKDGDSRRTRVLFKKNTPAELQIEVAPAGGSFEEIYPSGNELSESQKAKVWEKAVESISSIYSEVCSGPQENKKRFLAKLKANEADLRKISKLDDSDGKSAVEAL